MGFTTLKIMCFTLDVSDNSNGGRLSRLCCDCSPIGRSDADVQSLLSLTCHSWAREILRVASHDSGEVFNKRCSKKTFSVKVGVFYAYR